MDRPCTHESQAESKESLEVWWFKLQELSEEAAGEPDAHHEWAKCTPCARISGEPDMHRVRTRWASCAH